MIYTIIMQSLKLKIQLVHEEIKKTNYVKG
jgi:hypothetical protein